MALDDINDMQPQATPQPTINNRYMPDTFLHACDVARILRDVRKACWKDDDMDTVLRCFVQHACCETGWDADLVSKAAHIGNPLT